MSTQKVTLLAPISAESASWLSKHVTPNKAGALRHCVYFFYWSRPENVETRKELALKYRAGQSPFEAILGHKPEKGELPPTGQMFSAAVWLYWNCWRYWPDEDPTERTEHLDGGA